MKPRTIIHQNYGVSVLFVVPAALAKGRDVVPGDDWHTAPPKAPTDSVRVCRLDEYSGYGFLINPLREDMERGPGSPMYGFLLADALIDPTAFVQTFEQLPHDWNFGGLIAIDLGSGLGVSTNCDVAETAQWRRILDLLIEQGQAKVTFTLTDTGVSLERREGDILMQQFSWDVPADWGEQGRLRYPRHRFVQGESWIDQVRSAIVGFDVLCQEIEMRGHAWLAERLRGTT